MTVIIDGPEALATFRQGLDGQTGLELLRQASGRLLVNLPVGVGKTELIIRIIEQTFETHTDYDAVVLLAPRKDILEEMLSRLPASIKRTVLRARPRKRCGELDPAWQDYERKQCALLGRLELCRQCPIRGECDWPEQSGRRLRDQRLILATQQHLVLDPNFIQRIEHNVGANRMLTLVDESNILLQDRRCTMTDRELFQFLVVQQRLSADPKLRGCAESWIHLIDNLRAADEGNLKSRRWCIPRVSQPWVLATQRVGRNEFGLNFRYLGFDLIAFSKSDIASRRFKDGSISFASPVQLGNDFIIFSGSVSPRLANYRIDPESTMSRISSPFADYRFSHPDTRFINLNWGGGAAKNFPNNAPQIIDFFAEKIARNIRAGKRTLLIARKRFLATCAQGLQARLAQRGMPHARVITGDWDDHDLADPANLPLINYGVSGINRFENHDAAYCLTSYNVNPQAIESALGDLDPVEGGWKVTTRTDSNGNRVAEVDNPAAKYTSIPSLAQDILEQLEADALVQAIGRVRPFTKPREIISFHRGKLPTISFQAEFDSLARARAYFDFLSRRDAERNRQAIRMAHAQRRHAEGASLGQIAAELGVHKRTASRYITQTG